MQEGRDAATRSAGPREPDPQHAAGASRWRRLRGRVGSRLGGIAPGVLLGLRWIQARLISVWGLAIAAALCPPQVFTDLAVFTALANLASLIVLLRLDAVFFQNNDPVRLGRAFRLAAAAGLCVMILAGAAVLALTQTGLVLRGFGALFLITLGSRAAIRLLMAEATAEGDFATIGNANLVQAVLQPAMMLLLIWPLGPTTLAMLAADAFGHLAAALYLAWRRRHALAALLAPARWSRRELMVSARFWRQAPLVLLPSSLLSFAFVAVPLLALPYAANAELAAQLALAMRMLDMPAQLFAAVAVPMAMSTLRRHDADSRQARVRAVTLRLLVIAAAGFLALALAGLAGDPLLGATQWAGLGLMVAMLAPFFLGTGLVAPLHEMGALARRPSRQMLINAAALLAALALILGEGELTARLVMALGAISFLRMLGHARFVWLNVVAQARP